jgi:outer membrane immunogenic protein
MRRLAMSLLGLSVLSLGFGELACAAELPPAPVYGPNVVAAAYGWTGFYIGAHFGGGLGRDDWSEPNTTHASGFNGFCASMGSGCIELGSGRAGSHTSTGPLGGFQAGYNYQFGYFLLGAEGQFSWSNFKGDHENDTNSAGAASTFITAAQSDRFFSKVRNLGSIAARLGLVSGPRDRTLLYLKGGAAYASDDFSLLASGSGTGCVFAPTPACEAFNSSQTLGGSATRWGYMVGVGLEFGLLDNWTASVEYDYLGLGTKQVSLTGVQCSTSNTIVVSTSCAPLTRSFNVGEDIQLVKFGINYRFGYPAAVAAK